MAGDIIAMNKKAREKKARDKRPGTKTPGTKRPGSKGLKRPQNNFKLQNAHG